MQGIVFEGGGARGAYQVGAWKALKENGMKFTGVAGTSVGALNGAMLVQGDLERALEIWGNITLDKIICLDGKPGEKVKGGKSLQGNQIGLIKYIKSLIIDKGMDISPLRQLLHQCISEKRVRSAGVELGIVTVTLPDFSPLQVFLDGIPQGKLIEYLIASASLPFFKPQKIDGKVFLDGGLYDNLPIGLLASKGFKDLIVVRVNGIGVKRWNDIEGLNIKYICPTDNLGSMMDFSAKRAQRNIQLGYFDALKVLKGYKGKQYCIEVKKDEKFFLDMITQIDEVKLGMFLEKVGFKHEVPSNRLFLEKVIPLLADLMGLKNASYQDIILGLMEKAACKAGIDRFRVYSFEQLLEMIVQKCKTNYEGIKPAKLPGLSPTDRLLLRMIKEPLLDEVAGLLFANR